MKVFMSSKSSSSSSLPSTSWRPPDDLQFISRRNSSSAVTSARLRCTQGLSISFEPSAISVVWANSTVSSRP